MSLVLQLPDPLADELRRQAADEQTSAEELAQRLMSEALRERMAAMRWRDQNRRRLELIARKMKESLSVEEEDELQRLQALACEQAAPFDHLLHQTVGELQRELEQLPEEPTP